MQTVDPLAELARCFPPEDWRTHRVVVAVSGGADSTALLRALATLAAEHQIPPRQLVVAHFHHGLRVRADDDQAFVADLARELSLPFETERVARPDADDSPPQGGEARARELRYAFLTHVAKQHHARYLVTAHTANDQAETILFRLLRGTGIRGLAGIAPLQHMDHALSLVRPWLQVTREAILDFLEELGQTYREDETNRTSQFTRNRLRHEALPLLADIMQRDPRPQLVAWAERMQDLMDWIDAHLSELQRDLNLTLHHGQIAIPLEAWERVPIIWRTELLRRWWRQQGWSEQEMTAAKWRQVAQASLETRPFDLPGRIRVEIRGAQLCLTPAANS